MHGVLDGKRIELGCLKTPIATAIVPLLSRRLVRTQAVAVLPFGSSHGSGENQPKTMTEIFVNLFGDGEDGDRIGDYLSAEKVYLQHPRFPDTGYEYKNPHILSRPANPVITQTTVTGGIDIKSRKQAEESKTPVLTTEAMNLLDGISESVILDEEDANWRLTTPLMKYVYDLYSPSTPNYS